MNDRTIRIFLAEDNEGDVFLVRRALEKHGLRCDMVVARDGEEALRILEGMRPGGNEFPEVILLDLNLPRIDGTQLLQRIRKTKALATTPVVILTSSDSPRDRDLAMQLGANQFFRKPTDLVSFMQLGEVVGATLNPPAANPPAV